MFTLKLIVDGSPETLQAAQFALTLAKRFGKKLRAYAFIDPVKVIEVTGFTGAGLCGSGVFIEGYEKVLSILEDIGQTLMTALRARADGMDVEIEEIIRTDDPVTILTDGMTTSTLVVLADNARNRALAERIFETGCAVAVFEHRPGEGALVTLMGQRSVNMDELAETMTRDGTAEVSQTTPPVLILRTARVSVVA
jgi:nucleotide-binding universal stress UspA family protein